MAMKYQFSKHKIGEIRKLSQSIFVRNTSNITNNFFAQANQTLHSKPTLFMGTDSYIAQFDVLLNKYIMKAVNTAN